MTRRWTIDRWLVFFASMISTWLLLEWLSEPIDLGGSLIW